MTMKPPDAINNSLIYARPAYSSVKAKRSNIIFLLIILYIKES
jgi:hypothetical protein